VHAGERQQRLLRELEKLRLALGPGGRVGLEEIAELSAGAAERRAYSLADALVARDRAAAVRLYLELRARAERLPALLFALTRRVREALEVANRLDEGESPAAIRRSLRMPSAVAERFVEHARAADRDGLRGALAQLADLEVDSRGGRAVAEDTAALRTILRLSG
jgi:DNA polymerase III subunit delta